MAQQLIESLATDFDPTKYHDKYRERVLELIERKAAGRGDRGRSPRPRSPTAVPDLMAALEARLAAAKGGKEKAAGASKAAARRRGAEGAGQEAGRRSATPAKKPKAKTRGPRRKA